MNLLAPDRSQPRTVAALLRVLLVDDDLAVLRSVRRMLVARRPHWEVITAPSGTEGVRLLREGDFDAIVSDFEMPDLDGIEVLERARLFAPRAIRMILSGRPHDSGPRPPVDIVQAWLTKSSVEELVTIIESLLSSSGPRVRVGSEPGQL